MQAKLWIKCIILLILLKLLTELSVDAEFLISRQLKYKSYLPIFSIWQNFSITYKQLLLFVVCTSILVSRTVSLVL